MNYSEIANNSERGVARSTLSRAVVLGGQVSLAVLDTTALVAEGGRRHDLKGDALSLYGKTVTAACYLCGWLKRGASALTVSVNADGDFGKLSISGDGNLGLRGYLQNTGCVKGKLGSGTLTVVLDNGEGIPFAGTVPLVSEKMEENFARYFEESEQRLTGVALSVVLDNDGNLVRAGGAFLQALPSADEGVRAKIKEETPRLKAFLERGEYDRIFDYFGAQERDTREAKFACRCSKERVESLIFSMGKREALKLCEEQGKISVHCEYCNTDYDFSKERIKELFKRHE